MFIVFKFIDMQANVYFDGLDFNKHKQIIFKYVNEYYGTGVITEVGTPVSAPLEIPRLICVSKNGHSQLIVTGKMVQLATSFDENYNASLDKCYNYVSERLQNVYNCLGEIGLNAVYAGLITNVEYKGVSSPKKHLLDKIFKVTFKEDVHDVSSKFTFVRDERYYINVTLSNLRTTSNNEVLVINLDINDRYRYNYKIKEYGNSDKEDMCKIFQLHKEFFNQNVDGLVRKGEM